MRALVVGSAVSGRAASGLLERLGHEVVVFDSDPAALDGVRAESRHAGAWDPTLLRRADLMVVSPGVPEHAPPIRGAIGAGIPVWSEMELAWRSLDVPIGAVTGTNGKTTTTEIAALALSRAGMRVAAVGNIGEPLSDAVDGEWDALVVEASSFQLRFAETFRPDSAVILNVAPDHLDWHGDFDSYLAAKARIHANQDSGDVLIYDVDDPGARKAVEGAASGLQTVSGTTRPDEGWGREGDELVLPGGRLPLADVQSRDPAFLTDLTAAAVLAGSLGAGLDAIAAAAGAFRPGRHRREVVATTRGVTWVNDSKATNPHAALAAIRSFPSVVLVAGGRNKGLDVSGLGALPNVRHVIALGEAAEDILRGSTAPGTVAADMEDAVRLASGVAGDGDTVLLSPGCASFDMFTDYGDRGDAFVAAVSGFQEVA